MESEREKIIHDARFDRMEHHLKLLKESNLAQSSDISAIKTAVIGNEFSGGVGIIHRIKEIVEVQEKQGDDIALLKENLNFSKNIIKTLVALLLSYIAYLFTK
jgi:hypothetical protein